MTQHEAEATPSTPGDVTLASHRRDFLKKAGIAGAAAWVAPTILSSAAHAQGSGCPLDTLDWNDFTIGDLFTSGSTGGANPVTVSLNLTSLPGTTPQANNGRIVAGPSGGIAGNALFIGQDSDANGVGQTATFTFSQPVYDLYFTLTDIDNLTNGWIDFVEILTAGYTVVNPGSLVAGTGTAADRFRNTNASLNLANTDNRGNVTLYWAGPVSSVSFQYTNGPVNGTSQLIRVTNLNLRAC